MITKISRYLLYLIPTILLVLFGGLHYFGSTLRFSDQQIKVHFKDKDLSYNVVRTGNIRYVRTGGSPSDTSNLIVFVHGAPGSLENFKNYLSDSLLNAKSHMIAIDRPGYGYSNYGRSAPSILEQSNAIHHILDKHQYKNLILVGHSYGGPIVAEVAVSRDDVNAVIMLAPVNDPVSEEIFWYAKIPQWPILRWALPGYINVSSDEKLSHPAELDSIKHIWPKLAMPIIHLHDRVDWIAPGEENIAFSKSMIHPAVLRLIERPEKDHFIPWNDYEFVRDLLLEYLDLR